MSTETRPAMKQVKTSSSIRWTHITTTLVISWVIGMMDKISVGVVMADKGFLEDTALLGQPGRLGLLTTAMLVAYAAGMPAWGALVTKWGARTSLVVGMAIWALAIFMFGVSSSFESLLVWRVVLGFGEAVLYPVCNTFVYNWFPDKERARASSVWYSGTMIGPAIAGFALAGIITAFDWRASFYILTVATVLICIPMAFFLTRNKPAEHPSVSDEELAYIDFGRPAENTTSRTSQDTDDGPKYAFIKDYRFWMITLAFLFNNFFFWGWSTWLPSYLHQARGVPMQSMGNITSLIYACTLITIYGSGYLSDKLMRRAPFGAAGFLLAAGCVFLAINTASLPTTIIFLVGALMFQAVGMLMIQTLLQQTVNNSTIGRAAGIMNLVSQGLSTLSPFIVGILIGSSGGSYLPSFSFMAVCLAIAAAFIAVLIPQKY
ncbi:MFS transporter [Pseudarthrobacter enclensis]|uniref:Sugar phosphate permease n=1 Tax=Pseudarthrobacter enclensis TaxID=993070 RepID=A0ABT9RTW5_9MICC|nr:MFS transporter [Pseudarthrobacter enclensis]MDP9888682.1 sugar phosphate permease [Pseudarthrobacter enclensis]